MKRVMLLSFIAISLSALAQNGKISTQGVIFERRGYIDGIRLDSIKSEYVRMNIERNYIYFDYGQPWVDFANYRVKDSTGEVLNFEDNTTGVALNFMYYNGWEYISSDEPTNSRQFFIFRKKRN